MKIAKQILNKKLMLSIVILVFTIGFFSMPNVVSSPTIYDLTWTGTITTTNVGGALWEHFPDDNASGTGVFDTYLAIQAPGGSDIEYGLNHNGSVDFNEADSKTYSLLLSAVPIMEINGNLYREFVVDINQNKGGHLLSTEKFQIWQTNDDSLTGDYDIINYSFFNPALASLVYDIDAIEDSTIILDYLVNSGSGKADYRVYVPAEWFDTSYTYVTMFVSHGELHASNAGFEEWGVRVVETGCLEVTKIIDWNDVVGTYPDVAFEVCITGPSYPDGLCYNFTESGSHLFSNLQLGMYWVNETSPGANWSVANGNSYVEVVGGTACTPVEIINTYQPGCLEVSKVVDLGGVTGVSETFNICITGPSYPSGDCQTISEAGGVLSWGNLIPGTYTISETDPGAEWIVTGLGTVEVSAGPSCATATVTNTYNPGCVEVTKVIDWNGVVGTHPDVSFEVCIEGPSYPDGECHIFTAGGSHTFNDLIPGWYWVNETSPGANWSVTNPNNHVEVFADEGCAQVEIINTYQPGCLWVEKLLDLCGAVNLDGIDETFVINVIGPSYPTGFDIDFTMTDGDITSTNPVELSGLIPGDYTVSEPSVPEGWISSGSGSITISPGDECGSKIKSITNHLGRIFIEKYDGTTDEPLGNATFLIESQFNDWSITVVDNGANDYDPRPGMMEVLFVPLDAHPDETCFLVTEIVAPEGYDLSDPQTICLRAGMAAENLVFVDYPLGGCTYTPGYWMTHSWYGPAPYDETWSILGPDGIHELQNHSFYGSDETWLSIMSMKTTSKTKVYQQLAFHYVAAYLNGVYNGHLPSDIEEYLEDASDILGNYANDFKIPRKSMDETTARQITSILGEFNEGCYNIYWPHCDFATVLIHKTNYRDDSPLAGWNFNIQGGPCDVSYDLKTDSEGYIEIYLNPGRYTITEMLPDHWQRIDESDQIIDPFEVVDLSDDEILELEFINLFNHDPEAVDDIYSTDEDTPLVVDVSSGLLANDQDVDGDVIVYIGCSTPPSHGSVSISTDGSFVYTPDENYSGTDSFVYTISDGYFGTDTAMVNITILPVNDPPVAMFTHTEPVYQYGIVSFDASGSFDVDGSIVLYEWDWNNDGTFDNSLSSPSFDWDFSSLGMHTVVLRVTDNEGLTSTVAHTFEVI